MERAAIERKQLAGIGICVSGQIDFRNQIIIRAPVVRWHHYDLVQPLKEHYGVPVRLENDGNAHALGEYMYGATREKKDVIVICLGTGVGGGIIIDGKILHGHRGLAGEIGHMVVRTNGLLCRCGARGCLQAYCSIDNIVKLMTERMEADKNCILWKYAAESENALNPSMITKGVDANDAGCKGIVKELAEPLAAGIITLINLFNPELILLSGGISQMGERLLKPIREIVNASLAVSEQVCEIQEAKLGKDAALYGACALAMGD